MRTKTYISIKEFCTSHNIEDSYIQSLRDFGFVQLKDNEYIEEIALPKVEKIMRLHSEMDINFEGIEVILNLLERVEIMRREVNQLRNRLTLYENI